ncbi:hypothetical protein H8I69_17430 [Serratia fonticola]|uniref:hypothetical protein n=1 Tax=Serratia fonticola TaxID=47917 RepID=UPI0015C5FE02|nr:hypothetical protein [Serratia fonticola]MBC3380901.1 hypothetical protein [Serratia fonticola]NYA40100.1 hypothetical protein [Serratia fonticola]
MYITRRNFTPQNVFLYTNIISFLAWLFPSFGFLRKGFSEQYSLLTLSGLAYPIIIIFLYGMIWFGYHLVSNKKAYNNEEPLILINDKIYFASAVVSFLGLCATFLIIIKTMSFAEIINLYSSGQANNIKKTLYEDYSLGLVSLRYCVILSGSFVIYRRLMGEKRWLLDMFSFSSLICVSMISSRLTLIAGLFGGLYLYLYSKRSVRINFLKLAIILFMGFIVLAALNWSRNSNFYEAQGLGFFSAGFSEILAYVGTPVQGALYALSNPDVGNQDYMRFYTESTIEPALTTNSAILDVTRLFGSAGIIVAAIILFFSGVYISLFEKVKSGRYVYCNIAVFYSVVEFWRIFIFFQGIIITLLFVSLLLALLSNLKFKKHTFR